MAEGSIQLQPGRRLGRRATPRALLPLRRVPHLSNSISCWYCDFKSSVFNQPLFRFGQKYFRGCRWLRIWFSVGMGFSLTTLIGVTVIILLESARALNLYNGIPWLNSIPKGSISSVFKHSISVADVGYMCISSIVSVSIHELGHAVAAASEGIQIEYTAVFLAVVFPGALVAFNQELLQMIPRMATLRIYCAGIWHNAALCAVCAWTVFFLPVMLYPLYSHGENLMVLDVSANSPLYGYLSPGDLITELDGKRVHTTKEWMEMAQQIFQNANHDSSKKGYCVPSLVIAQSNYAAIVDDQITCPNELASFTSSNDQQHIYCLPAKGVLGMKKCGDGCPCTEDESCFTPVQMPGVAWVEMTYSRPQCRRVGCNGSFVFIGDVVSMAHSVGLTEYEFRWWYWYGGSCIPGVLEKLLVSTFHVSLMLALLNSLPVYYLDGESILEVALCCVGSAGVSPRTQEALVRSSLLGGTLLSSLLLFRIFLI